MPSDSTAAKPKSTAKPQADKEEKSPPEPVGPPKPLHVRFWHFIKPILILVIVLFAIRSSIIDWNDVPTGSMKPTILDGDRIVVNKLAYDLKVPFTTWHIATWSSPKRGDIVVFFSPDTGTRLVKRCVGLPGDTLEVRQNKILINGVELPYAPLDPTNFKFLPDKEKANMQYFTETIGDHVHPIREGDGVHPLERYPAYHNQWYNWGPITIPKDKYFMMGDNRDDSADSRFFKNFVDRSDIVGRATAIALSVDLNNYWLPRWSRFFSKLP